MTIQKGQVLNPAGRARKVLDAKQLALVEELAAKGSHETSIAHAVDVDPTTWARIKERDKRAARAFAAGRAKQHDRYVQQLDRHGEKSFVPAMFMLKAKFGYRDQGDADGDQRPHVTIVLPAAASLEAYRQAIEVKPDQNQAGIEALPAVASITRR